MEERLEAMEKKLDMLLEAVLGDPTDVTNPGLLIRLDRLERSYLLMKRIMLGFGSGGIVVIATTVAALILRII